MTRAARTVAVRLKIAALRGGAVFACALLCACSANRPMSQMQGDCANYELDLTREIALSNEAGGRVKAAAGAGGAPLAALDQKLTVELLPQAQVDFVRAPERRGESADRQAGMLRLRVPKDGGYRISTSTAAWVDLIAGDGSALRPAKFEMQTQCKAVFKTVVFALRASETYIMQVSASRERALPLYIVPHPLP